MMVWIYEGMLLVKNTDSGRDFLNIVLYNIKQRVVCNQFGKQRFCSRTKFVNAAFYLYLLHFDIYFLIQQ